MSRQEFYENAVYSMGDYFENYFGEKPLDIMDFDYSFDKVHWTMALECAYQEFLDSEE